MKRILLFLLLGVFGLSHAQDAKSGEDERIYSTAGLNELPEYPGGMGAFYSYVQKNMRIPVIKGDLNVMIYTTFVINADGTITDITVVKDPGHGLGEEARKVLEEDKTVWKPGVLNGKPVRVRYALPIKINIKGPKRNEKKQ